MRVTTGRKPVFQHTAARRRLQEGTTYPKCDRVFQHTAARRRLPTARNDGFITLDVSTHSRPKAAALDLKH